MVKLAHAVYDERGKASGGAAGDSTGREVCLWDWYDKPWTHVFRAKKKKTREKIASCAAAIVQNDLIGYDQGQRTTLFTEAKKVRFKIAKITTPCETDCSAMVAVCINAAKISISKDMYTGNEADLIQKTLKFLPFEDQKHVRKTLWLKRGDVLLGKGHTAIVLNDGAVFTRELRAGSMGADVKLLQEALTDLGYSCGALDGELGQKTQTAIKKFQTLNGLSSDGVAGKKTISAMQLTWQP